MIRKGAPDLIRGLLLCALATPLAARDIPLALPLDCDLGDTCHIQAHFDHDPGPGAQDFECGTLTRDNHRGTDFALPNLQAMREGVDVLAAAPGTVRGTRDRWPDISISDPNAPDLEGQECGNGVAINHGGGWVTQYCHLKQGSISVKEGDRVAMGAKLGEVGLSGSTEFPHLHFSVFEGDARVDPFAPGGATCGADTQQLFDPALPSPPAGFLAIGFATSAPEFAAMRDDLESAQKLSATAPIVIWVSGFGSRPGDLLQIDIAHPSGTFHSQTITMERRQEVWQRFTGRKFTDTPWPSGTYTAEISYTRDGVEIVANTITAQLD